MNLHKKIPSLKFCKLSKDFEISTNFINVIRSSDIYNVFNPSFYSDKNLHTFAFRAIQTGETEVSSFFHIDNHESQITINLSTEFTSQLGVEQLIDPKITKLNDEIYLTFNSGWKPGGNEIFIMKIYPNIESPKKLVYANRQRQERNWAFFYEDGEIYALYWINPLVILRVKEQGHNYWEFEDFHSGNENQNFPNTLSIGTQLSPVENKYCFVAHSKNYLLNKKIYMGKFCSFDFRNFQLDFGKHWLVHSLGSMFGNRIKHNTNLFSCTYFSGIQWKENELKLGYGINDLEFGFSSHKLHELI